MQIVRWRSLVLVAIVAGAIMLMSLDQAGRLGFLDMMIQDVYRPMALSLTEARAEISGAFTTVRDLRSLRRRNSELEALVQRLTVENLQLNEVLLENEQLREFFKFAQINPTYDYRGGQIIARVINEPASPYSDIVRIDLGSEEGIAQGMPVVTDRGLVGRIVETTPHTSQVLLLTDPNSAINVMTQSSRAPGMLGGRAGQLPLMDFIPDDVGVSEGEIVITSGLGGNFPKGLIVGQITEVLQNDNRAFQQAIVQHTVDFERLELVLVITSFPPQPQETPEEIEAAATPTP
ncbi:MAG: rod shape-determining protein MreC [Caldilineales bacterium]|nr:rod shape-determining protein MreC [Caldilineales bacterium]